MFSAEILLISICRSREVLKTNGDDSTGTGMAFQESITVFIRRAVRAFYVDDESILTIDAPYMNIVPATLLPPILRSRLINPVPNRQHCKFEHETYKSNMLCAQFLMKV